MADVKLEVTIPDAAVSRVAAMIAGFAGKNINLHVSGGATIVSQVITVQTGGIR